MAADGTPRRAAGGTRPPSAAREVGGESQRLQRPSRVLAEGAAEGAAASRGRVGPRKAKRRGGARSRLGQLKRLLARLPDVRTALALP